MLFNKPEFFVLFLVTFVLYYLPALRRVQIWTLIAASLVFYAWKFLPLLLLLLISVTLNAYCSYKVKYTHRKRFWATTGVVLNLSILAFFKYSPLLAHTFMLSGDMGTFLLSIPLPIGISFFTFQGITLLVDVYKEQGDHQEVNAMIPLSFWEHLRNTCIFITFFPHSIAGPIVKAHDFLPQIKPKTLANIDTHLCFKSLVTGYFLKMVIADQLKNFTFWIEYPFFLVSSSSDLLVMLFGYSMQIFADFAGYSLIAIGIAALFGYRLQDNFDFPYISTSFSEFWRRWHISLSSFLREYLYIPLGGNRVSKSRVYLNLMIVMFLGGLWHGAAWSYAVWGTAHGLALAVERMAGKWVKTRYNIVKVLQGLWVFLYVTLAWLLFKLPNFNEVILYLQSIANNVQYPSDKVRSLYILLYAMPVLGYHFYHLYKTKTRRNIFQPIEVVIYGVMIFLVLTNSGMAGDFIYFQF